MKVLLVEDDASIASSVVASLGQSGLEVSHVSTGVAGIDSVKEESFDVVLMDLGLPDMDGLRIRAVTRRSGETAPVPPTPHGRLHIDERAHTVSLDGEEIQLTAKEFDLLAFLASEPNVVFRRNDILEHVWDTNWYGTTKTLDAHIASIRKKLGNGDWIQAVRGVGFKFVNLES